MNQLADISLQFTGNETFLYPPSSYAFDHQIKNQETGVMHSYCGIALFGNLDEDEDYYNLGAPFLKNYYILLNYTDNTLGLNGNYYMAEAILDKPDLPDNKVPTRGFPLWGIILIAIAVIGVILGVCIYLQIRSKNKELRARLNSDFNKISQF